MSMPLISSQFVTPFKFWHEGQIQAGMHFRNELFQVVAEFSLAQRQTAFELAWRLSQQHDDAIVMTASTTHYCIWIKIRSREYCRSTAQIA